MRHPVESDLQKYFVDAVYTCFPTEYQFNFLTKKTTLGHISTYSVNVVCQSNELKNCYRKKTKITKKFVTELFSS